MSISIEIQSIMSDMELMDRAKKNCTAVMSWKRKAQTCETCGSGERADRAVAGRFLSARGPNSQRFQYLLGNGALLAPCRRWIGKCKCARN